MSDTKIQIETGRFTQDQAGTQYARASGLGALRVADVEPDGYELTRAGLRFYCGQSAALTGIAPVQAMPTTAAQWVIWNPSTTKSLVFDRIGLTLISGTAGAGIVVVGAIITLPANSANKSGITISSASGSTNTSVALINSGVTVTSPAAPGWFPIAKSDTANTAILSVAAFNDDVRGRVIVPPLKGLGLCALSPAGTSPLYAPIGCSWFEIESDTE